MYCGSGRNAKIIIYSELYNAIYSITKENLIYLQSNRAMSRYAQNVSAFWYSNNKRMKDSVLQIFLSGSYHLCNGKDQLRENDGGYQSHWDKSDILIKAKRRLILHCERVGICEPTHNSNDNEYQAEYDGEVAEDFKKTTGAIEFFKKIHTLLKFTTCKSSKNHRIGVETQTCFTA